MAEQRGPFYAYDAQTLDRAEEHGCLDEDVNTGDWTVCSQCINPTAPQHPHGASCAGSQNRETDDPKEGNDA